VTLVAFPYLIEISGRDYFNILPIVGSSIDNGKKDD
jgi:hypothetical protein